MCCSLYSPEEKQIFTLLKDDGENCWNLIENKYPKPWEGFHAGPTDVLKQWHSIMLVSWELRSEHASVKLQIDGHLLHY